MLNVLLVGYGELASALMLGIIESGHNLVGVFRWAKKEQCSATLKICDYFNPDLFYNQIKKYKVQEISAKSINSKEFRNQALRLEPDIILVSSWGEKLNKDVIVLPKIASVNCHPSLLPKFRGSNPYFSTIKFGEKKSGVTFHLMNDQYDAGEILLQKEVEISTDDTGGSLRSRCAYSARNSIKELLDSMESGNINPIIQNESESSYFPKIQETDITINWDLPALDIHNSIRAVRPWAYCYAVHFNHFLRIGSSTIKQVNHYHQAGKIIEKGYKKLIVATKDQDKVLELSGIKVYAPLSGLWSNIYYNNIIKAGDILKSF